MRAHMRTRTDFGRIRLIWQNLAEVDQGVKFIYQVFYWDIPTVTRLVLLQLVGGDIVVLKISTRGLGKLISSPVKYVRGS